MDWLGLLAVQGTLKSLVQHHSSKASVLQCSAFFTVQFSHPHTTTGKTIGLTRWTFVSKVTSLLFHKLSRLLAEEAEVEQFLEGLQNFLELTSKKDVLFIIADCNAKIGSQEIPGITGKFGLGVQNEAV